ncbi:MAG: metal-dependent hydrolase [Chloroflexota bacterium]
MKITFLSHSSFVLDDGAHTLVIDPFLSGNPKSTTKPKELTPDYIALSHAHGDHLGDAFELAERSGATIIAVNELAIYAASKGLEAAPMHIGGGRNFDFGRLKFTIAHHGSSTPDGRYMGEPAGMVITMGGKTVYHTGDTGLFLDMKLIGELNPIDVMMCPIGDNFTMDVSDAAKAVEFVNPKLAIPMHYNTFPLIEADPHAFAQLVATLGIPTKIMEVGETIEI